MMHTVVDIMLVAAVFINFIILGMLIYLYISHRRHTENMASVKALEDILHNEDDFGRINDTETYRVVSTGRRDKTGRTW